MTQVTRTRALSPDASVVIPAYNRAALVGDAVVSCLVQQGAALSLEVIAVDDGSTDATLQTLRAFGDRIRVIALPHNSGRNVARNAGLQAATGDYVKFLDSDDVLVPGALAGEVAGARASGADLVVAGWEDRGLPGEKVAPHRIWDAPHFPQDSDAIIDAVLAGVAVPTGACLYRREFVASLRWDENLRKLDDWDWFVQAALRARRIARFPGPSYHWRAHDAQGTRTETLLRNAIEHHAVLHKTEDWLRQEGRLTESRRMRLAQYYYKELRVLSLYDRARFHTACAHITALDARFTPVDEERQFWMRLLARMVGFRSATLIHSAVKRAVRRL